MPLVVLASPVLVRLPPQVMELEVVLEAELFVVTVGGFGNVVKVYVDP